MAITGKNANWNSWTTDFRKELADAWANLVKDKEDWRAFTSIIPSTSDRNDYGFLKDPPAVSEWKGARKESSMAFANHVVLNKDWQVSVPVPRNDFEDDKYDLIKQRVTNLIPIFDRHIRKSILTAYDLGAAAGSLGPDSVPFFGNHTLDDGSTVSNMNGAVSWILLDSKRTRSEMGGVFLQMRSEPTLDEFGPGSEWAKTNKAYKFMGDGRYNVGYGMWQAAYASSAAVTKASIDAGIEAMLAFDDANGDELGIMPDTILIPTTAWAEMRALTEDGFYYDGTTYVNAPYKGMLKVYPTTILN